MLFGSNQTVVELVDVIKFNANELVGCWALGGLCVFVCGRHRAAGGWRRWWTHLLLGAQLIPDGDYVVCASDAHRARKHLGYVRDCKVITAERVINSCGYLFHACTAL